MSFTDGKPSDAGKCKLIRNLDTAESRDFWDRLERNVQLAKAQLPEWLLRQMAEEKDEA